MSKYLVEASKSDGLFKPYGPRKYYIVSRERLSKMLLGSALYIVWTAKYINPDIDRLEDLKNRLGEIEVLY